MDFSIKRILHRSASKKSKASLYRASKRIADVLEEILNKYPFKTLKNALGVVESPEDMILPWEEADPSEQKETLALLNGAEEDARRFLRNLDSLLGTYESFESLDSYLVPILDREYSDLFSIVQMHI